LWEIRFHIGYDLPLLHLMLGIRHLNLLASDFVEQCPFLLLLVDKLLELKALFFYLDLLL
jgi:hypothetical protein